MAISINFESMQYGVKFDNAYFRIVNVSIFRHSNGPVKFYVAIDIAGYAIANPTTNNKEIDFRRYNAALEEIEAQTGNSFFEKCYAWVMAQPDMAGAKAI